MTAAKNKMYPISGPHIVIKATTLIRNDTFKVEYKSFLHIFVRDMLFELKLFFKLNAAIYD
jgi:hypothetical protein